MIDLETQIHATGYEKEHMGETQALKTEVATQAEEKYQHEAATGLILCLCWWCTDCAHKAHATSHTQTLTGNAPTMRTITVPPRSWVDDMRTPVPEVVLAEFHRQKALLTAAGALLQVEGRLEGKVDGAKENTSSNAAPDTGRRGDDTCSGLQPAAVPQTIMHITAAAPDSETQTTTESHGPTSRIPKLLRGIAGGYVKSAHKHTVNHHSTGLTGNRGGSPKTKEVPAAHVAEPARLGQAP